MEKNTFREKLVLYSKQLRHPKNVTHPGPMTFLYLPCKAVINQVAFQVSVSYKIICRWLLVTCTLIMYVCIKRLVRCIS